MRLFQPEQMVGVESFGYNLLFLCDQMGNLKLELLAREMQGEQFLSVSTFKISNHCWKIWGLHQGRKPCFQAAAGCREEAKCSRTSAVWYAASCGQRRRFLGQWRFCNWPSYSSGEHRGTHSNGFHLLNPNNSFWTVFVIKSLPLNRWTFSAKWLQ